MKKRKFFYSLGISILGIGIIASIGFFAEKKFVPRTIYSEVSYSSDVRKPEFLASNSDVIIEGKVIAKAASAKGTEAGGRHDEVIYTDTSVVVEKVISNKTGKQIQPGDTLVIRRLGGTFGNITMKTDSDSIMKQDENHRLLFLADSSKNLMLPSSTAQIYSVVGNFNGSFVLKPDGLAVREVVGDEFNYNSLIKPALIKQ